MAFKFFTLFLAGLLSFCASGSAYAQDKVESAFKVGWIGAMTGPVAKWGVSQSAKLAEEEINSQGGINGRKLEIIYEDGRCESTTAVTAFQRLVFSEGVRFILGGHCTPESLPIAALANPRQVLSIASITSTPKLSDKGDYIFRITPVSTRLAELIVPYARKKLDIKSVAIISELTDYVQPPAEKFKQLFEGQDGQLTGVYPFNPGETDFRSILLTASSRQPEAFYIGVQSPDTALLIMRQLRAMGLKQKIFGNEQFMGAYLSGKDADRAALDGVVFAEPVCNMDSPETKKFADKYKDKYKVRDLPFGCYTAEPYDAVKLLAEGLGKCGYEPDCVKEFLYNRPEYQGASGPVKFDKNGDSNRKYILKQLTIKGIEVLQDDAG